LERAVALEYKKRQKEHEETLLEILLTLLELTLDWKARQLKIFMQKAKHIQ